MCSIKDLPIKVRQIIRALEKKFGKDEEYFRKKLVGIRPENVEEELAVLADMLAADKNLFEIAAGKQSIHTIVDCSVVGMDSGEKKVVSSGCDTTETYSRKRFSPEIEARKILKNDACKIKTTLVKRHARSAAVAKVTGTPPLRHAACIKGRGQTKPPVSR